MVTLWITCYLISALFTYVDHTILIRLAIPLIIAISCLWLLKSLPERERRFLPYLLFFSISITSITGLTGALNGFSAESTNLYLYGFSFYSASLAFYVASQTEINISDALKFSNPLLLFSGPIALFIKKAGEKSLIRRLNYYLPFVLIGVFFFHIIASPLTQFLYFVNKTDLISVLTFAIIFEIFIYANFCGLSLAIYGIFGILGYRIPLNFRQPFSSTNVVDFWKGWHTSLSAVLKRLFYSPTRLFSSQLVAIFAVFIASGLWHGITVNFLFWGVFHAVIFYLSLTLLRRNRRLSPLFLLLVGIIIGRLIFADSNTDRLLEKLTFSFDGFNIFIDLLNASNSSKVALLIGILLVLIEFLFQRHRYVKKRNYKHLRTPASLAAIVFLMIALSTDVGDFYAVYGQR